MIPGKRLVYSTVPLMALVGGVAGGMLVAGNSRIAVAQSPAAANATERATAVSLESAFEQVSDTVGPSTVFIEAEVPAPSRRMSPFGFGDEGEGTAAPAPPRTARASGSGVVVRADGYILTNDHVVESAIGGKVTVKFPNGASYPGTVTRDRQSDLALVKIKPDAPLTAVKFADSDKLHVGQWAIAIGSPFGFDQQNSMTTGIVSALHRQTSIGPLSDQRFYPTLVQTDAAINQGNSGGPLLNINGELIGINVALFSPTGTSAGIAFAIPSNTAKFVVEQLLNKGKVTRGFLGVLPANLTPDDLKRLGDVREGALISECNEGTPAFKAGIKVGDVITRFNDQKVTGQVSLRDAIASTAPGKSVPVEIVREKKPMTLNVTLAEAPEQKTTLAPGQPTDRAPGGRGFLLQDYGMSLGPVTEEVKAKLNNPKLSGVVVRGVRTDSAAAEGGLMPGTIVISVSGKPVARPEDVKAELAKVKKGETVLLRTIARNGKPGTATLVAP